MSNVFSSLPGSSRSDTYQFPDPFLDLTSMAMPASIRDVIDLCEFVWLKNGTYRRAASRIARYFITGVEVDGIADEPRTKLLNFLNNTLRVSEQIASLGDDFVCLHGDTKVPTKDGVFKIRDLAGKTVDVISGGGVYRPAKFESHGRQPLLEVEFSDGRTVLATPEHEWEALNCAGKSVRVPTTELRDGYHIPRVVAPRPDTDDEYYEGVRHGFVFGDGSVYDGGKWSVANFFGKKIDVMAPYFTRAGFTARAHPEHDLVKIHSLPSEYKTLPDGSRGASYWYGFVSGFLAADGLVDTCGCVTLAHRSKAALDAIAEQLPRIGMAGGPVEGRWQKSTTALRDGGVCRIEGAMYYLTLLKQHMQPQDLLMAHHRERFEECFRATPYGRYIGVRDVRETGIVDEVFCCVEPETHAFVIENGILTGNCYGNSFSSVIIPFRRFLMCKICGRMRPIEAVKFEFKEWKFSAHCPKCGKKTPHDRDDQFSKEEDRIKIKRWSPRELELEYDSYSQSCRYYWRVPRRTIQAVTEGDPFTMDNIPWEVVEAIRQEKLFLFNRGVVFHMAETAVSGVDAKGWGIPQLFSTLGAAWYDQMLHRYNEALVADYLVPFRVLSPEYSAGRQLDPSLHVDLSDFKSYVSGMVREHRRDPASFHTCPVPVRYQTLGGEAGNLVNQDMLRNSEDQLLNAIGAPTELYRGTLQMQAMPTALRLFQQTWPQISGNYNAWTDWATRIICTALLWDKPERAYMKPVMLADDIEIRQIWLQLAASNLISKQTAYSPWNINPVEEQKRIFKEMKAYQEQQQSFDEDQAKRQMLSEQLANGMVAGGGMAGGAAPGMVGAQQQSGAPIQPGGLGMPAVPPTGAMSPTDMMEYSQQMAQQLVSMPYEARRSQMTALKQQAPAIHAQVKQLMQDIRQEAGNAGKQQLLGQGAPQM